MPSRLIEVVGSLNIDLVTTTSRMPGPGETLAASGFSTGFGGKGANQAVAAARLSRLTKDSAQPVRMIGAVGDDQFGRDFLEHLDKEGINSDAVKVKAGSKTGTAVIIVEEQTGENRILFSAGANDEVGPENIDFKPNTSGIAVFQLETPLPTVLHAIKQATVAGKETILNPAPATPLPDAMYRHLSHLVLNESEASILSGISEEELSKSLDKAAQYFIDREVVTVLITLGSKGVYWQTQQRSKSGVPGTIVSARKVKAVDTTAAGDTFVGAYAAYLARHEGGYEETVIAKAVDFANHAAALTVQKHGAQASIPLIDEVEAECR